MDGISKIINSEMSVKNSENTSQSGGFILATPSFETFNLKQSDEKN